MSRAPARRRATAKQVDPTRTAALVRLYARTMQARLDAIKKAIRQALDEQDVFGLRRGLVLQVDLPGHRAWSVLDLAGKNKAFGRWLNETLSTYFLEDIGIADTTPGWIARFVRAAYSKGASTALAEIGKTEPALAQLKVEQLINVPFHRERLVQLFDRNFTELKGFTSQMATGAQRVIADGLVRGDNPVVMARDIAAAIDIAKSRAERIARTEVIRTHAEAQLNTFERFGIADVSLEAEWITAEDDRVCDECQAMSGKVFSVAEAHGMIPLHPNCRCNWIPVVQKEGE